MQPIIHESKHQVAQERSTCRQGKSTRGGVMSVS